MARWCAAAALAWALASGVAHAEPERPARRGPRYQVRIDSEPPGAAVYLDGNDEEPVGTTPHTARLQAGRWQVALELEGHERLEVSAVIKRRRGVQKLSYRLVRIEPGVLEVRAAAPEVEGAEVLIDGEPRGEVPGTLEIVEGPHQVEVVKDGYRRFEEWVQIVKGERTELEVALRPLVAVRPPPPPPPVDEPPPRPPPDPGAAGARWVAEVGFDLGGRRFAYRDPITSNLRPYDAGGVPLIRLAGEAYPARTGRLADLGVVAGYARSLFLESSTRDGTAITTVWSQLDLGVRGRHRFGRGARAPIGAVTIGYARAAFTFVDPGELAAEVPEVDYRSVRIGVDGRLPRGKLGLSAGLAYHGVLSAGGVADRFDAWSAWGLDLHAGAALRLATHVEARLVGHYQRFATTFTAEPSDEYVAAGAADQLFGVLLGLAYVR